MVIIPLLERHWGSWVRGSVASWMDQLGNKPREPNERTEKMKDWTPGSRAHLLFIPTLDIHKSDVSDIIKWCHFHLLLHLGENNLCTCTVELCQLICTSSSLPDLFPISCHTWTITYLSYPNFIACDIYTEVELYLLCTDMHYTHISTCFTIGYWHAIVVWISCYCVDWYNDIAIICYNADMNGKGGRQCHTQKPHACIILYGYVSILEMSHVGAY